MKTFKKLLKELQACDDARIWAADKPIEEVVKECHRGDWMLWLARKLDVDIKPLTLTKGYCAKTVEHLMKDERSKKAVQAAINFGKGKITKEELADFAIRKKILFESNNESEIRRMEGEVIRGLHSNDFAIGYNQTHKSR